MPPEGRGREGPRPVASSDRRAQFSERRQASRWPGQPGSNLLLGPPGTHATPPPPDCRSLCWVGERRAWNAYASLSWHENEGHRQPGTWPTACLPSSACTLPGEEALPPIRLVLALPRGAA